MRVVCALLLLVTTAALASVPARHLDVCKPWACLQESAGLAPPAPGAGPPERSRLHAALAARLPAPEWAAPVERALDVCYGARWPRRYSATCPGQDMWHCLVDQLIDNCPESKLKKQDACSPVASLVGVKYLFLQNIYLDIENNMKKDQRPPWFLKNYLSVKCCELPSLFPASTLVSCNVTTFLNLHQHHVVPRNRATPTTASTTAAAATVSTESTCTESMDDINPLECCNVNDIVPSEVFGECGVEVNWDNADRLTLREKQGRSTAAKAATAAATVTEATTVKVSEKKRHKYSDIKVVPVSCGAASCALSRLGAATAAGALLRDGFAALLDNVTREYPEWRSARARVHTRCLARNVSREYDADCEIGGVLACTLDVMAENCPNKKKGFADPCRHSSSHKNTSEVCQVSSSKYRRTRHRYCDVPPLAPPDALRACGLTSLARLTFEPREPPAVTAPPRRTLKYRPPCIEMSNSTRCVLEKLGALNSYGFLDAARLRERAGAAAGAGAASRYRQHCTSTRQLLNVLDTAIVSCPLHKRKYTNKCTRFYKHLSKCAVTPEPAKPKNTFLQIVHPPLVIHFPWYAPKHNHYVPATNLNVAIPPFAHSRAPPTAGIANLAGRLPNLGQPFPPLYSPSFPYNPALHMGPKARPLYRPYFKDGFRSMDSPFFVHNKIAEAHKGPASDGSAPIGASSSKFLLPVEGQVYE